MGKMEGKAGEGETRTYNFNLHGRGRVRAYVHAQTVVVRLVVGAVVREDEGDVDGAVVRLEGKVEGLAGAGALVFYAVRARGLLEEEAVCARGIGFLRT